MALSQALKALADAARQGGNLADLEAGHGQLRAKGWEPDY
jgi:pantoate--beta-alanine ligase